MGFELGLRQWLVLGGLAVVALGLLALLVGVPLRALLDVSRRSDEQFAAVGENRRTWLLSMLVATFVLGPGWLAAIVYLRVVRPRVEAGPVAASDALPAG